MHIGAHVSIAGSVENSVDRALQLGCETFQIFTKNQTQWKEKQYSPQQALQFRDRLAATDLKGDLLAVHNSYLINLCSVEPALLQKSRLAFLNEATRCAVLGIPYLIFHPGSHLGQGEEWGITTIAESINWVLQRLENDTVLFLLETTAGQGSNLGYRFEQLQQIMERIAPSGRIGICVDTCHIFAAGYDLRDEQTYEQTVERLQAVVGLDTIKAFHLNDCKSEFGSRVDRHERIGKGKIGLHVFRLLINDPRWRNRPGFLEVPGGDEAFKQDIAILKKIRGHRE
jgi:deoxyribonuclease IV